MTADPDLLDDDSLHRALADRGVRVANTAAFLSAMAGMANGGEGSAPS